MGDRVENTPPGKLLVLTPNPYREMQIFLLSYILVSICEIFTTGQFPLDSSVRIAFTAIHLAAIASSAWILMLNGAVGYQQLDDGTALSLGLLLLSAAAIFIATGYIALDTGFGFTGYWESTLTEPNRSYSLYTLYQLAPLIFLVVFFVLETVLVLHVLGEARPMSTFFPFSHHKKWIKKE